MQPYIRSDWTSRFFTSAAFLCIRYMEMTLFVYPVAALVSPCKEGQFNILPDGGCRLAAAASDIVFFSEWVTIHFDNSQLNVYCWPWWVIITRKLRSNGLVFIQSDLRQVIEVHLYNVPWNGGGQSHLPKSNLRTGRTVWVFGKSHPSKELVRVIVGVKEDQSSKKI